MEGCTEDTRGRQGRIEGVRAGKSDWKERFIGRGGGQDVAGRK